MSYYCPSCGNLIDGNIFFQATGQCVCGYCGQIVDLNNVSDEPIDEEIEVDDL